MSVLACSLTNPLCPTQDVFGAEEFSQVVPVTQKILRTNDLLRTLNVKLTLASRVVVVVYFILSRLLYLAFSANLGLLCMPHSGMGPLV